MINETSAEFLLSQLFPEKGDKWMARHKGTFYRNYNEDAMAVYEDEDLVELSRDGFLKLLPDEYLTCEEELKGKNRAELYSKMKQRLHLLDEAFMPVDTMRFRGNMRQEAAVQPILQMWEKYLIKTYFDFDFEAEQNEYIRQVAVLLPYVSELRGDIPFVRKLIEHVTEHQVETVFTDFYLYGNHKACCPLVIFKVYIDGLTEETYAEAREKIGGLVDFLTERFMPFDIMVRFDIIGENDDVTLLEYNSIL